MSSKYRVFQVFFGHAKHLPKILYDSSDVMIIGTPSLDRESDTMTVTWAFMETPWLKQQSSIRI